MYKKNTLDIKKTGYKTGLGHDFYHSLMKMPWWKFMLCFTLAYLMMNGFFAFLYYLGSDSIENVKAHSYWEAFLFSFQTSTTIGYGHFLPKSNYAHIIMILDSISGILFVALATGLAFTKFARPTSRVVFSKNILLTQFNKKRTLMFRLGNARDSQIVDARIQLALTLEEESPEGISMRRIYDLKLVRSHTPLFGYTWSVMHILDEKSPLRRFSEEELQKKELHFIITINGIDEVFSQNIYDRHIYEKEDLLWDHQFVDLIKKDKDGHDLVDYKKFHATIQN